MQAVDFSSGHHGLGIGTNILEPAILKEGHEADWKSGPNDRFDLLGKVAFRVPQERLDSRGARWIHRQGIHNKSEPIGVARWGLAECMGHGYGEGLNPAKNKKERKKVQVPFPHIRLACFGRNQVRPSE
jgi:hypothetical protein